MCESACSAGGIEEIGKMKPDSRRVGSIDDRRPSWKATCWVSARVEMNTPQPSPPARKRTVTAASQPISPRTGTSKSAQARASEVAAATVATRR